MNNIHDMGGMHGFGPIPIEQDEPVFHENWEARAMALASQAWWKTGSSISISMGPKPCMPPRSWMLFMA